MSCLNLNDTKDTTETCFTLLITTKVQIIVRGVVYYTFWRLQYSLLYNFKAVFWPYFRILNYKSKTGSLAKIANALFCKTKMLLTKTKINYDSNISVNFVYLKKKAVRHKIRVSHTSLGKQNIFYYFRQQAFICIYSQIQFIRKGVEFMLHNTEIDK